jgi:hypothetical protein
VVFTSATLSLAALERFVHADSDLEPETLSRFLWISVTTSRSP